MLEQLQDLDRRWSLWMHEKGVLLAPLYVLKLLDFFGDGIFWIPTTAAISFTPSLHNSKFHIFFFNLFMGILFDVAIVGTLKFLVRRPRPVYNKGIHLAVDHWSFPSGHSSRALFLATFFFFFQHQLLALSIPSSFIFFWAILTAVSRILLGRHFVSDVIVGAILGVAEAFVFSNYLFLKQSTFDYLQSFWKALE